MNMSTLIDLQQSIGDVAGRVGPAVVGFGRGWGRGSGVVVGNGRVITCAHNLRTDRVTVAFSDGRRVEAQVAGTDPDLDLAAVAVDTGDIEPVEWSTATAQIGAAVVALANPGGRGLRATPGFVSSTGRSFRGPRGRRIEDCVEHTAPLPTGSGGGPVVDLDGKLLGLNAIRLDGGLILAVPAGKLLGERSDALFRGEQAASPRLGVAVVPARAARRLRRAVGLPEHPGVLVRSVLEDSAAERAGLTRGDLIASAGGQTVESIDDLYTALDAADPAGDLELEIMRGAERLNVTAPLAR
jgi:S1-C subfamily serine protease